MDDGFPKEIKRQATTECQKLIRRHHLFAKYIYVLCACLGYYWYANRTEHRRLEEERKKRKNKSTKRFWFVVSVILESKSEKKNVKGDSSCVSVYDVDDDDDDWLRWKNELRFGRFRFATACLYLLFAYLACTRRYSAEFFFLIFFFFFHFSSLSSSIFSSPRLCPRSYTNVYIYFRLLPFCRCWIKVNSHMFPFSFSFIILLEFQSVSSCSYPYQRIGLFFTTFRSFHLGAGMHNMDARPALFTQCKRSEEEYEKINTEETVAMTQVRIMFVWLS